MTARQIPSIARHSGLVAALGAAALVLTGCASSATSTSGSSNLPKLHIGGQAEAGPAAADAPAPAAAAPNGAAMAPMMRVGIFGGYVLAGSLPDSPTHAAIWTWSGDSATQADAEKLAAALGVQGTPKRHAHGWELTTAGADLRVSDEPGHPWSYNKTDTAGCPTYEVDVDNPGDGASGCGISVPPGAAQPADGPDETATKAAAASLLSALGISGDEQYNAGTPWSTLTVSPTIGGLATQGIDTTVSVDASGVEGATGQLEAPTAGADYPLRTAASAFTALQDQPRPMIAPFCGPIPVDGSAPAGGPITMMGTATEGSSAAVSGGGVVSPASPVPNPVTVVVSPPSSSDETASSPMPCPTPEPTKVTGATLGLQIEYGATDDGAPILAPAWFFTTADGGSPLAIVAIDSAYLEGPSTGVASASPGSPVPFPPATPVPFPPAARASAASSPTS